MWKTGLPFKGREKRTSYYYMVHYEDGKRKKCYLGPAEKYELVSKLHGFEVSGLMDKGREIKYLMSIIEILEKRVSEMKNNEKE